MASKYTLIVYWSQEDDTFLVEVPKLPGCMADGQSYEKAVANAQMVIEEWIATARELGRPIPEPGDDSGMRDVFCGSYLSKIL